MIFGVENRKFAGDSDVSVSVDSIFDLFFAVDVDAAVVCHSQRTPNSYLVRRPTVEDGTLWALAN